MSITRKLKDLLNEGGLRSDGYEGSGGGENGERGNGPGQTRGCEGNGDRFRFGYTVCPPGSLVAGRGLCE